MHKALTFKHKQYMISMSIGLMLVKGSIADRALLEACRRHLVVHLVYAMPPFPAFME